MRTDWPRSVAFLLGSSLMLAIASLSCLGSSRAVEPIGPKDPAMLSWNQPLTIQWNQAIADFSVQVTPTAEIRSSVAAGGRVGYVYLDPVEGTTEYQVTITNAVAANGAHLLQPASFTIEIAQRPQLQSSPTLQREADGR